MSSEPATTTFTAGDISEITFRLTYEEGMQITV